MELKLEIFGALCCTSKFEINGIAADSDDFGDQGDHDQENAEDYACGDMRFERKASTADVLDKYKITEDEYQEIAEKLEDGLSFGCCDWCV
jgi:hypothetical protein